MFYRIRDDTTGCEPRKLFNGAPPAVALGLPWHGPAVALGLPWHGWEAGVWAGRALSGRRGDRRSRRRACAVVEFLMHDKNYNGSIDLDECVTLLYARFGKVRPAACPSPAHPPPACRLPPPTSHLPPPA